MKNPVIWLDKSILGLMSGTSIFPDMKLVQGYSNCSDKAFIIDQIEKKIKESKKKTKLSYTFKAP